MRKREFVEQGKKRQALLARFRENEERRMEWRNAKLRPIAEYAFDGCDDAYSQYYA